MSIIEEESAANQSTRKLIPELSDKVKEEKSFSSQPRRKSILELSHEEARHHLLKSRSYCNFDLPEYIGFDQLIKDVDKILLNKNLSDMIKKDDSNVRGYDDVNYTIMNNKDGKYAWRPIQFIHPALYVSLVHHITKKDNWGFICDRFKEFSCDDKIFCLSMPVFSLSREKDNAEQITHWWEEIEQKSIELSLEYKYLLKTDITDCYGAIYTHAIEWALHTKEEAKKKQREKQDSWQFN